MSTLISKSTFKENNNYLKLFAGIVAYRLSLVLAFYVFVLKYYSDDYFVSIQPMSYLLSCLLFLLSAYTVVLMLKVRADFMSGQLFLFAYLFSYVPISILCSYMWNDNLYSMLVSMFWILIMLALRSKKNEIRDTRAILSKTISNKKGKNLFIICVSISIIVTLITIYSYNKFNFSFSFDSLYEIREEMKSTVTTLQGLIMFCMAAVIVPILLGIFIKKKKLLWVIILCVVQVLLFLVGGDKFYLMVLAGGIILSMFYKKRNITRIPMLFALIIMLATFFVLLTEGTFFEKWVYDICVRRVLFTPANLNYYYFDFCKTNAKILFTDHPIISRVLVKLLHIEVPYDDLPIADVLGLYYWNQTGKSTGGFGNAFAQVGYGCLIIYPVLFLFLANVFDWITYGFDEKVYMPLVVSLTVYLLDYSIAGIELTYVLFALILYGLSKYYLKNFRQKKMCINGKIA